MWRECVQLTDSIVCETACLGNIFNDVLTMHKLQNEATHGLML